MNLTVLKQRSKDLIWTITFILTAPSIPAIIRETGAAGNISTLLKGLLDAYSSWLAFFKNVIGPILSPFFTLIDYVPRERFYSVLMLFCALCCAIYFAYRETDQKLQIIRDTKTAIKRIVPILFYGLFVAYQLDTMTDDSLTGTFNPNSMHSAGHGVAPFFVALLKVASPFFLWLWYSTRAGLASLWPCLFQCLMLVFYSVLASNVISLVFYLINGDFDKLLFQEFATLYFIYAILFWFVYIGYRIASGKEMLEIQDMMPVPSGRPLHIGSTQLGLRIMSIPLSGFILFLFDKLYQLFI